MTETQGVRLNGDKANGESYETFHLRGTDMRRHPAMSGFCKTENQPYDEVVKAILMLLLLCRCSAPLPASSKAMAAGITDPLAFV